MTARIDLLISSSTEEIMLLDPADHLLSEFEEPGKELPFTPDNSKTCAGAEDRPAIGERGLPFAAPLPFLPFTLF